MMKKMLLFVFVCWLFNNQILAQAYVKFPTSNANWNVCLLSTCRDAPSDTFLLRYSFHGDTTINQKAYRKLCLELGDTLHPTVKPIGGLREENKKVYYLGQTIIGNSIDEEYLLYDFSRQIGDTIKHDSRGFFYSVVLAIDSVVVGKEYRKRFKVNNHWFFHNPDFIIEGIGSVKNGLLGHISDIPTCGNHYWEHICFCENGELKYLNSSFDECFPANLYAGIKETASFIDVALFPNPAGKVLHLRNNSNQSGLLVRMVDMNGRLIGEQSFDEKEKILDLTLAPMIFTVQILSQSGTILKSGKVIRKLNE